MQQGSVIHSGEITDVVSEYSKQKEEYSNIDIKDRFDRRGFGEAKIISLKISNDGRIQEGDDFKVEIGVSNYVPRMQCKLVILDKDDIEIAMLNSTNNSKDDVVIHNNKNIFTCEIFNCNLVPGEYKLNITLTINETYGEWWVDHVETAAKFQVINNVDSNRIISVVTNQGVLNFKHKWIVETK